MKLILGLPRGESLRASGPNSGSSFFPFAAGRGDGGGSAVPFTSDGCEGTSGCVSFNDLLSTSTPFSGFPKIIQKQYEGISILNLRKLKKNIAQLSPSIMFHFRSASC